MWGVVDALSLSTTSHVLPSFLEDTKSSLLVVFTLMVIVVLLTACETASLKMENFVIQARVL